MPVKELVKTSKSGQMKPEQIKIEKQIEQFISKGGGMSNKRKERVGNISRNLWILEVIDREVNKV